MREYIVRCYEYGAFEIVYSDGYRFVHYNTGDMLEFDEHNNVMHILTDDGIWDHTKASNPPRWEALEWPIVSLGGEHGKAM